MTEKKVKKVTATKFGQFGERDLPSLPGFGGRHLFSRREWLHSFGMGLGGIALSEMLGRTSAGVEGSGGVLGGFHFPPKAKRVIYLFQSGGPSQLDLHDPKPLLVDCLLYTSDAADE